MANATKIFVSATSSDLKSFRNQVKGWLIDMGWLPVVQDHFAPDDNSVVDMLKKRLRECDAVIHIVGQCYGAEPQGRVKGEPRRSFTQLEAVLARKMRKRVFLVLLDENFPYDPHTPEPKDRQVLQNAYRIAVAEGDQIYIPCREPQALEPEIRKLRVEVDKLKQSRLRAVLAIAGIVLIGVLGGGLFLYHVGHKMEAAVESQQEGDARAEARQKRIEDLLLAHDSPGGATAPAATLAEIRSLLRPDIPEIDSIPDEKLPGMVKQMIEDLQNPSPIALGSSGTVEKALREAQTDEQSLNFAAAANKVDKQLAQVKADQAHIQRDTAALYKERGRIAGLQLRYREAAGFYRNAAELFPADPTTARQYILEAAAALFRQGKEFGDNAALAEAIDLYRSLANDVSRAQAPDSWAAIQNALGDALEKLGERDRDSARLEEAVATYSRVLEVRKREDNPLEWAKTQTDLGYALERLGERDDGNTRFEAAIEAYDKALDVLSQDHTPEWAMAENDLGNAQLRIGENDSGTTMLEAAVGSYAEALKVRTEKAAPLEWAATKNNLGLALQELGERETGTERLRQAVDAFKDALRVRTEERVPLDWAMTEDNLGLALEALGERETGTQQLQEAVKAFTEALKEQKQDRVPHDWANTQNNLGLALRVLGERETGTEDLEKAVAAYAQALKENTHEKDPEDWAMTQENLGTALKALGEREAGTARLNNALDAYSEALKEYKPDSQPLYWAETKNDIGNVLTIMGARQNGTRELEMAIAAYKEALQVRTLDKVPLSWAESTGDEGTAMMILAARTNNAAMANEAMKKIEVAFTTAQGGGDRSGAARYEAKLAEARALIAKLSKH